MRRQASQYFQSQLVVDEMVTGGDLAEYSYRSAAFMVGALETRKAKSFFLTSEDYSRAYDDICQLQIGILMGAKEDIIREVRGMRGGRYVAEYDTDLTSYPVGTYPGASINDIVVRLGEVEAGDSLLETQTIIIARLTELVNSSTSPEDNAENLRLLTLIASLLGP